MSTEKEKPNYYAILTAEIRYADITPNAKLLYAEITALSNQKGYCWASNKYFADLYETSTRSITRWINELEEIGALKREIITKENGIAERRLNISQMTKMSGGIDKNVTTPHDKNVYHNTTSINTTFNKKEEENMNMSPTPINDFPKRFEKIQEYANMQIAGNGVAPLRGTAYTLREYDRRDIIATFSDYSDREIGQAIDNYALIRGQPFIFELFPTYTSISGFLRSGVEKYCNDAEPLKRCRKTIGETQEEAEQRIKRVLERADDG